MGDPISNSSKLTTSTSNKTNVAINKKAVNNVSNVKKAVLTEKSNNAAGETEKCLLGVMLFPLMLFGCSSSNNRPKVEQVNIKPVEHQEIGISQDNIINILFDLESEMYGAEDIQKIRDKVAPIILMAKEKTKNITDPRDKLKAIYKMLRDNFMITFANQENVGFFKKGENQTFTACLKNNMLDCDTTTFLFLAIAHELKFPIYAAVAPEHLFMRWDDGKTTFNFDYGEIHPDNFYIDHFKISKQAIINQVYLRSLSPEETIGVFNKNLADAKFDLGDYQSAIYYYEQAFAAFPKDCDAYNNCGAARMSLGNFQVSIDKRVTEQTLAYYRKAISDYTNAITLDPGCAASFSNLGIAKLKAGDPQGALTDCIKAIRLSPENSEVFYNLGIVHNSSGNYREAINDYTKAIVYDNNNSRAYNNRGGAKFYLRDYKGAISDWAKTLELDPNRPDVVRNIQIANNKLSTIKK